jgi:hypothetical protein
VGRRGAGITGGDAGRGAAGCGTASRCAGRRWAEVTGADRMAEDRRWVGITGGWWGVDGCMGMAYPGS